jgi:N-acetylglucosamine kinase-like BadF-type ATPase
MAYFLALDAGGTKTDYVLADEERTLARVRTGTIKRMRTDAETAASRLNDALTQLTRATGVAMDSIARTCIGTAGETVPLVTDWLHSEFAARVAGERVLVGDVVIALDAAFQGGPGILVLAGTGSNVAGRASDGSLTGAGGWGPALADQGSGHRIGHQALRALFLAGDEGRSTILTQAVPDFWLLPDLNALIEHANRIPSPDFSLLAQLVLRCAEAGDEVAMEVLRREGEDLAYLVRLVARRLVASHPSGDFLPAVAFAGSIMEKIAPLRHALIDAVRREFPAMRMLDGVVDPIDGALWRARTGGAI